MVGTMRAPCSTLPTVWRSHMLPSGVKGQCPKAGQQRLLNVYEGVHTMQKEGGPLLRSTVCSSAATKDAPPVVPVSDGKQRPLICVDMSDFENRKEEITRDLMDAATGVGFMYIINHGIPQDVIDAAFAANKRFLTMPDEIKLKQAKKVDKSNQAYIHGYSVERNAVAVLRNSFLAGYHDYLMEGRWPLEEDIGFDYKRTILTFMRHNHAVVERIMSCFALGLGLQEDYFKDPMAIEHEDNGTTCNNNYYPSMEGIELPADILRIYAHVDYECLSLLHNLPGQNGLEVCPGRETNARTALQTAWTDMDPIPGAIVVNLGESLEYWSDGVLKANFHRVRYPRPGEYAGERQSIAYFSNCRFSTVLQGPKKRYPPYTFQDVIDMKAAQNLPVEMSTLDPETYVKQQQTYVLGPELPSLQEA